MAVFNGDDNANTITGAGENDTINGFGGADILNGGAGSDIIAGGTGADTLSGDNGNDVLDGGDGGDILYGGGGADELIGGAAFDFIGYLGAVGVTVNLTTLTASGGEAQGDVFGADIEGVIGSGGNDTLTGNAGANSLWGLDGNDVISGLAGNDTLIGHGGDDLLRGGAGIDSLYGGAGADTATYFDSAAGVTVDLAAGTGAIGDAQFDSLNGIENLSGSNIGDDELIGDSGANTLHGHGGNDMLRGGGGADSLFGDAGTDTANYSESAAGVTVDIALGTGAGGDAQGDTLNGIENVTGSNLGDTLTGSSGANTLWGFAGDDLMRGGAGADSLLGDAGVDTATYFESAAGVTVDLAAGTGTGGNAKGDTLNSIENLSGSNVGDDSLTGGSGANILRGYGGDDVLRGGAGADTIDGGTGTDLASYYNSGAAVTANLATGTGSGSDAQGDILVSIENVNGSAFNDTLTGSSAANALRGLTGRDTLTGGGGADRFVYAATSESAVGANRDVVTDFSQAQADKVDLSQIDADSDTAGNQAFAFIGTGLYTGVAGQLRTAVVGGETVIAGDVDGDGASDFHIALTGTVALVAGDFQL